MTLDEFRRHPAYDNYKDLEYIRKDNEFYFYLKTYSNLCKYNKNKHIQPCNYCPLARYLCLGIDCRAVILKQVKYEKK